MGKFDVAEFSKIDDLEERADLFEEAMEAIWDWDKKDRRKYLRDYAKVAAFLSDAKKFNIYFEQVDQALEKSFWIDYRKHSNWFTTTCRELFAYYGAGSFADGGNLVMIGSAFKIFGPIVSSGYLFKDGTGPGHGEYTHTLQWLTVARAASVLKLEHTVYELYTNTAGCVGSLSQEKLLWPSSGKLGSAQEAKVVLWQYLVDCFPDPERKENLRTNLYSTSYRTPSHLMGELIRGSLYYSFVSIWFEIRSEERPWGESPNKEKMRIYHEKKQSNLLAVIRKEEGFNTFIPKDVKNPLRKKLLEKGMEL